MSMMNTSLMSQVGQLFQLGQDAIKAGRNMVKASLHARRLLYHRWSAPSRTC